MQDPCNGRRTVADGNSPCPSGSQAPLAQKKESFAFPVRFLYVFRTEE